MDAPKDAINNINKLLASINDNKLTSFEFVMDDCDWLEAAKSALEKQIPSKPQEEKVGFCDLPGFFDFRLVCPKCHKAIINTFNNIQYKPSYCQYCGKALKWDK